MITIRLGRGGRPKRPYYTLVVTDSRKKRDGGHLAELGQFTPKAAEPLKAVDLDALKAWVKKGASLSDTVCTVLKKHKINIAS